MQRSEGCAHSYSHRASAVLFVLCALICLSPAWGQRVETGPTGNATADALFIGAEAACFNGKVNDCITILKKTATDYAGTKAGLRAEVELAKLERATGNQASAKDRLTKVLSVVTTDKGLRAEIARAQYERAWEYLLVDTQPDYTSAITEFQKLTSYANAAERDVDESTVDEKGEWQIAHCLLAQKQTEAAIAAFKKFIVDHPNCYLAMRSQEKLEQLGAVPVVSGTNSRIIPDTRKPDPTCGPKALVAVINEMGMQSHVASLLGDKARLSESELIKHIVSLSKVNKDGTSFECLRQAAADVGLHAKGYRLDLATLKAIVPASSPVAPTAVIAWVNRNHFIAVLSVNGSKVKVFDSAGIWSHELKSRDQEVKTGVVSVLDFEKMWAGGPGSLGNGYGLVIWRHGDEDPVVIARERIERPKKLARNLRVGLVIVLACLIPLSGLGYPVSVNAHQLPLSRRNHRRLGRITMRLSALGLICAVLVFPLMESVFAVVTHRSQLATHQFVPEYPVVRELTQVEMQQIKGTQGSAPSWQSSSSLVSCSSCGGGTSSNLSYSANGDGGNVFGLTKLIQGGGQVLPFGLQIYFSTHDATVYGGMAIGALKTNFHMKINGAPSGYINVQNPTTTATIIEEDGTRITFTRSGGAWTPPAGHHETLADRFHAGMMGNIFDGYTYTRTNQMQHIFDYKPNAGSQGVHPNRLASIKDPNNNTTTVAYTGADSFTIDSATDHAGRVVDWQYPETNLTTITDWASRVVKLDGRTSNQWKIIDASNNTATLNTQPHGNPNPTAILITSFVDALNNTYTFSYDTSQTKPPITAMTNPGMGMGSKSVSYGTDGQGNKTTTITDEEGHKRRETYHATTKDLLKIEVEFTVVTWTTVETRTHDSDHNVLSRTNGLNKTWDMTYDTRGNLLTVTNPSVGGAPRTQISMTYDTKNNRLTFTNELSKVWRWEYNANSNMTSEQDPVQAAAMPPVKTTYSYNANGTRATMTNALGQDLDIRS